MLYCYRIMSKESNRFVLDGSGVEPNQILIFPIGARKSRAGPNISVSPNVAISPNLSLIPAVPYVSVSPNLSIIPAVSISPNLSTSPNVSVSPNLSTSPNVSMAPTGKNNYTDCFVISYTISVDNGRTGQTHTGKFDVCIDASNQW